MSTALVTGASSGIGREFCRQLAREGWDLVVVARNTEKLQKVAARLGKDYGTKCEILPADLTKPADTDKVAARLVDTENPIDMLVNNAGHALGQTFVDGKLQRELDALDVMVRAVLILSHAAAGAMKRRGRGGIINISSVAAGTAMGTYAAAKAWVNTFSEVLATELKGTGVHVTSVRPGTTETDFFDSAGFRIEELPTVARLTATQVVSDALAAHKAGKVEVVPSLVYKIMDFAARKGPRVLVRKFAGNDASQRFKL
ncbi:MAG: SDR family oxidoreductase [Actinomycetaceae bacterium]|nr:SDR family oxidoreductase [Actinomycetaceae bacterium]